MRTQTGGIVTGWLIKVVIMLMLFGLIVFEAGAVVVAKVGVDGSADAAAREAAGVFGTTQSQQKACDEADAKAVQGGARLVQCEVSQDAQFVTVTLERKAATFFIHKIGAFKSLVTSRSSHTVKIT